ncbi:MAG TPA: DUF1992 domain-containing protein [Blastocatellia bacterium]|nr:DUF1992 domain-containing protein [Blastocatellia bacterium]
MSIEKLVEERIKEAIADGEFDNIPGKGEPLNLDWYFNMPEEVRLCYSILKNSNFVPEEAGLLKEIEALRCQLDSCSDENERVQIRRSLNDKTVSFNMLLERRRSRKPR